MYKLGKENLRSVNTPYLLEVEGNMHRHFFCHPLDQVN